MKHLSTLILLVIAAVLVGACGAQPVPTVNPADVAGTAQAAAMTIVAQTQAAIPTNTVPPPTETPTQTALPTNTQLVLPTQELSLAASPTTAPASNNSTSNAGADPCDTRVLTGGMKGNPTKIRIANDTKGPIVVSVYLHEEAGSGACGYASFQIAKNSDVVIDNWVQGCYDVWAWSGEGAKEKFNSGGGGCINNSDKWTFFVTTGKVIFSGP